MDALPFILEAAVGMVCVWCACGVRVCVSESGRDVINAFYLLRYPTLPTLPYATL